MMVEERVSRVLAARAATTPLLNPDGATAGSYLAATTDRRTRRLVVLAAAVVVATLATGVWHRQRTSVEQTAPASGVTPVPDGTPQFAELGGVIRPDTTAVLEVAGLGTVTVYTTLSPSIAGPIEVHCLAAADHAACGGTGGPLRSEGGAGEPAWALYSLLPTNAVRVELRRPEGTLTQTPVARTAIFTAPDFASLDGELALFAADGSQIDWNPDVATVGSAPSRTAPSELYEDEASRTQLEAAVNHAVGACLAEATGTSSSLSDTPVVTLPAVSGVDYDSLWPGCVAEASTAWEAELDRLTAAG